ncbi:PREDICTED: S-formylglutathione hydrolase, partial [Eurypyga helias]|uniref:S-formylglutathione hydrolase n=1 Tax=Eurypyga helias TaxID=54383 RepID=UPI0005284C16
MVGGCNIEGEDESWDFGTGAGFYVDATEDPWKTNYRMYSYIKDELPKLINANFPTDPERMSIFGHSMGGHGALILALKNPGKYKSVSAFAPICNPIQCQWGKKALGGYLGSDVSKWEVGVATAVLEWQLNEWAVLTAGTRLGGAPELVQRCRRTPERGEVLC